MAARLSYIIEFVAGMDRAIKCYRDGVGLPLKFQRQSGASSLPAKLLLAFIPHRTKIPPANWKWGSMFPTCSNFMQR
jgi:hypothetical protein